MNTTPAPPLIYVVEDDPAIARLVVLALQDFKFEARGFHSAT